MRSWSHNGPPPGPPLQSSRDLDFGTREPILHFEYFEMGPGSASQAGLPDHNILINFGQQVMELTYQRDEARHELHVPQGSGVVTPAGTKTSWRWSAPIAVGMIWARPAKMAQFLESRLGVMAVRTRLRDKVLIKDEDIFGIAQRLHLELKAPDTGTPVFFEALSRAMVITIFRKYHDHSISLHHLPGALSAERFGQVVHHITSNISAQFTIQELAALVGMSRSAFAKAFRQTVGMTPMQFVMQQRIATARQAVTETSQSIGQIAYQCGFSDQAHMNRQFQSVFGVSPSQMRRSPTE